MPLFDGGLNGQIANAQIYNTALSAAQIKFLYENPYFMYQMPEELYGYVAATGGIDTENKRRSAMSLPWDIIFPVPDGSIDAADRRHLVGLYSGLADPQEGNPSWYYNMLKRRNR